MKHPTDLGLLNEAREKTEGIIDQFHGHLRLRDPKRKKERTCRQKARRQFLAVARSRKPGARKVRKAIGRQLGHLRRNLGHIDRMLDERPELPSSLSGYEYKYLLVIRTLHQQQSQMHAARGKAGRSVEFGAKLSIGHQKSGYVTVDTLSWDSCNESGDLAEQIESYKARFGHCPASVHADGIYLTRANRKYCKERGRPRKAIAANLDDLRAQSRQRRQDAVDRIPVEGKFGNAKRARGRSIG